MIKLIFSQAKRSIYLVKGVKLRLGSYPRTNYLCLSRNFSDKDQTPNQTSVESLFISDTPQASPSTELFPINPPTRITTENSDFEEYNRIINTAKNLVSDFQLEQFKIIMNYLNVSQVTDSFLYKQFEIIFVKNLNQIDYITKSLSVNILGEYVIKKKTAFIEDNWYLILRDFKSMVEHMNFSEYDNYIVTFDRIVKRKMHEANGKFSRELEHFISYENINLFNSGRIQMKKIEDVYLFSKLIHMQIFKIGAISDHIWSTINKIIAMNTYGMNIYESLIITSLFINFQEISGKANLILPDAIKVINAYITTLLMNFELLDCHDQESLINYSDNLFNYYAMFGYIRVSYLGVKDIFNTGDNMNDTVHTLINIYTEKLKSKNNDFMIFKEFRIFQLLAKEINYKDQEFWKLCADKTLENINKDLIKIFNDLFPKRILKAQNISEEDKAKFQEKCDLQMLMYVGMILETFSSAEYYEFEFWQELLHKIDKYVNFKNKEIIEVLNFISVGCKKLYRNNAYEEVWLMFIEFLDVKFKILLKNPQIVDLLVRIISYEGGQYHLNNYNSMNTNQIPLEEYNKLFNSLFTVKEPETHNSHIKLFFTLFAIIENKIKDDDKVLKILSNILVDLVKENISCSFSDYEMRLFRMKLKSNTLNKMEKYIVERIKKLIIEIDLKEENENKSFHNLLRRMVDCSFMDNLDIVRLTYDLEKEEKITENIRELFQKITSESDKL